MSFTDNFGNPKGLLGRMMLVSMDREHLPMAKWAFGQIKLPSEGYIADIGCGGGYNIKRMLKMTDSAKLIGLDISDESVRKAKKVNKDELGKRVKIMQGSAEKLPFKQGSISYVTAFETVFFWKDLAKGFAEVFRALKAGGGFAVINNYGDPNTDWEKKVPCMKRCTAQQISVLMQQAGFQVTKVSEKGTLFLVIGRKVSADNV
ncbi:MAG: class I SAM-dependent methyltransferase [Ruminococcus sp.]|nr:class I SAM-dependent methyltransferase [Ruminococcus sp.]